MCVWNWTTVPMCGFLLKTIVLKIYFIDTEKLFFHSKFEPICFKKSKKKATLFGLHIES